jgi:hypothetical protein
VVPLVVAATQRGLGGWLALTSTLTMLHHEHPFRHSESFFNEAQKYSCRNGLLSRSHHI